MINSSLWYRLLFLVFFCLWVSGCGTLIETLPGFRHTAFLTVGAPESEVLPLAEHVLGTPKAVQRHGKANLSRRQYSFSQSFDLVLYFFNGKFAEADFYNLATGKYDNRLPDAQSLPKEYYSTFDDVTVHFPSKGELVGYMISSDQNHTNIDISPVIK